MIGMKAIHLLMLNAVFAIVLLLAAAAAGAQARPLGPRNVPRPSADGPAIGNGSVWVVEREVPVIVEKEVVREVAVPAAPPAPAPPPRKPYAIGASYDSLPGGCMKMIEGGNSFYDCSGGEWFRQKGREYVAVAQP